jgi:hypothetical protein
MDYFTRRELELLLEERKPPCISIYLPTERTGPESEKDRILLKNLLSEVKQRLKAERHRRDEIEELTAPMAGMLESTFAWPCGCDGLAIFRSPELFRRFRLPVRFGRLAVVSDSFHIRPLLPLLTASGSYYVLALSRGEVKLFHASDQRVTQIPIPESPESIEETLRFDDPEKQLQYHTGSQARGGRRSAVFHGQGVGTDDSEENTLRYLKDVDSGVHAVLRREAAPLVLAAVEELQGLYRRVNTYPHLTGKGIVHNPEELTPEELRSRAWNLVEPLFARSIREVTDEYLTLDGHDSGERSSDIATILPAARSGQVGKLLVAQDERLWGRLEAGGSVVVCRAERRESDVDLLDLASAETLRHGGSVYAVTRDKVPGDGPIAAILRYPVLEKS